MSCPDVDVIVVGAGHAGVEGACAAARCGVSTLLITSSLQHIAQMSCNPAIGGLAKGQIVREIDALGGVMAQAIDRAGIQFRMLNRSKGPAVWAPRAQADKWFYQDCVRDILADYENLNILEATVTALRCNGSRVTGVQCHDGTIRTARAVVITAGTFLRGLMHVGSATTPGGRWGEDACCELSDSLERCGITLERLKTGTPPRLDAHSIDYRQLTQQDGDTHPVPFSFLTDSIVQDQVPCHITWTSPVTHAIIRDNFHRAPLYTGQIQSVGPRYCPSIETKIERFADKDRHQIFLEPEGRHSNWVYCNGISTSLPEDVQQAMVHSIVGLEQAKFLRYGYAIEYDYIPPIQIRSTLETRVVSGLFTAGQINGTSGYEEAGGQGLLAGLNAARFVQGLDGVILRRDQAYIGVMIDDLVTRGIVEPYRMFTSRAEYRLLLRSDNAETRLTPTARQWGLIDQARWDRFEAYRHDLESFRAVLHDRRCDGKPLCHWLTRPGHDLHWLETHISDALTGRDRRAMGQAVIEARYDGYITRQQSMIDRMARCEVMRLPGDFDYRCITALRRETQEILNRHHPDTIGQASRITGVNPADITVLLVYFQKTRS